MGVTKLAISCVLLISLALVILPEATEAQFTGRCFKLRTFCILSNCPKKCTDKNFHTGYCTTSDNSGCSARRPHKCLCVNN